MKGRYVLIALVVTGMVVGAVSPVQAVETPDEDPTLECEDNVEVDIDAVAELYNNNTDAVPSVLSSAVTSNTTELQIRGADQENYTAYTDGLEVERIEFGSADEPDAILITSKDTACDMYFSEEPVSDFEEAYSNDEIEIEAKGTVNSAAVFVIEAVYDGYEFIDKTLDELF